ncbi:NrsF family protein [Glacieibacterium megasporae]|uniref:NrsF family protein n=1 Tax=Glacieibacterium megasporae TaxID=2835787 RepID=UPI001C1DFF20|nr:DUF1109 domain-containing protein [Polymorphobacter megasporae]UAJ10272.1 DUF1109 domain-containing protein [Polymorphobacter megasporae]
MASDLHDPLIDRLTADLQPVRRRLARRDAAILLVLIVVEVAVYVWIRGMRADMPLAMGRMAFWWKAASLCILAAIGAATALAAFDPTRSPRRGLRGFAVAAAVAIAIGWGIDAASHGSAELIARLDWREGLRCVFAVVVLSLPALLALGILMRRGAPTDPGGTASAVGLTAAAWGGAVFVVACPHDDPLYVALWFSVAIAIVAWAARLILPRLTRW